MDVCLKIQLLSKDKHLTWGGNKLSTGKAKNNIQRLGREMAGLFRAFSDSSLDFRTSCYKALGYNLMNSARMSSLLCWERSPGAGRRGRGESGDVTSFCGSVLNRASKALSGTTVTVENETQTIAASFCLAFVSLSCP